MADIPDEMERLNQQRRIIDVALRDAVAERDRLLDIATDLWCSLFGATREVENVAQLTIEQAAMLPGVLKGYTIAANEERDRLRAVVDAVREQRAIVDRLIGEDHEPEAEIGLDEEQWATWRRITEMLDQLDVSPDIGDFVNRVETFEMGRKPDPSAAELNRRSAEEAGEHYIVDRMMGRTSCGAIGAHQPFCPLYDPGDEGVMVPPVHGRGDRSTPHIPNRDVQGSNPSAGGADDEQSGEDVQGGGLPGSAVAAEEVVAGDAPADEGGTGEGGDAGAGTAPARGEVGPGVGGGEWMDL